MDAFILIGGWSRAMDATRPSFRMARDPASAKPQECKFATGRSAEASFSTGSRAYGSSADASIQQDGHGNGAVTSAVCEMKNPSLTFCVRD